MPIHMDIDRIKQLQPGIVLVRIDDTLGKIRKSGLFEPGHFDREKWQRDTAWGEVLEIGPSPDFFHESKGRDFARDPQAMERFLHSGKPWPEEYVGIKVGDNVLFPRDCPMVIVHDEKRHALIYQHEIILAFDKGVDVEVSMDRNR